MRYLAIILTFLAAPCFAQEVRQQVEIIAMDRADAETCKVGGCKIITAAVHKAITERFEQAAALEEIARRQNDALKRAKDNRCM